MFQLFSSPPAFITPLHNNKTATPRWRLLENLRLTACKRGNNCYRLCDTAAYYVWQQHSLIIDFIDWIKGDCKIISSGKTGLLFFSYQIHPCTKCYITSFVKFIHVLNVILLHLSNMLVLPMVSKFHHYKYIGI